MKNSCTSVFQYVCKFIAPECWWVSEKAHPTHQSQSSAQDHHTWGSDPILSPLCPTCLCKCEWQNKRCSHIWQHEKWACLPYRQVQLCSVTWPAIRNISFEQHNTKPALYNVPHIAVKHFALKNTHFLISEQL